MVASYMIGTWAVIYGVEERCRAEIPDSGYVPEVIVLMLAIASIFLFGIPCGAWALLETAGAYGVYEPIKWSAIGGGIGLGIITAWMGLFSDPDRKWAYKRELE